MQLFDTLAQLFNPAPVAPPPEPQQLTPPAAVKPAVMMTKPRMRPPAATPRPTGDDTADPTVPPKPRERPQLGPLAAVARSQENADPGRTKLFDNFSGGDVGAGINNVPAGLGPISSFAYGLGGAMSAKANRRAAEAKTEAAAKQQEFENSLKTSADKRSQAEFDQKYTYVDKSGRLTPAASKMVNDAVQEKAIELGLHTSGLTGDDRKAAQAELDSFRESYTNDILNGAGVPDKLGSEFGSDKPYPRVRPPKPKNAWESTVDTVTGAGGAVRDAVGGAVEAGVRAVTGTPPPPAGQPPPANPTAGANQLDAAHQGGTSAPPIGQPGGAIRGGGTHDDPKVLTQSTTLEEFQSAVPLGSYYVDPNSGKLMRRTK